MWEPRGVRSAFVGWDLGRNDHTDEVGHSRPAELAGDEFTRSSSEMHVATQLPESRRRPRRSRTPTRSARADRSGPCSGIGSIAATGSAAAIVRRRCGRCGRRRLRQVGQPDRGYAADDRLVVTRRHPGERRRGCARTPRDPGLDPGRRTALRHGLGRGGRGRRCPAAARRASDPAGSRGGALRTGRRPRPSRAAPSHRPRRTASRNRTARSATALSSVGAGIGSGIVATGRTASP